MSTSSEGDEGSQDQAFAPPRPTPIARPALQARDAILAVQGLAFLADAQMMVPTLMIWFSTDLSPSELATRLEWLWLMRRHVATHLRDTALRGHLLQQSPEQILASLFQEMEELNADLR